MTDMSVTLTSPASSDPVPARISKIERAIATAQTPEQVKLALALTRAATEFARSLGTRHREDLQKLKALEVSAKVKLGELLLAMPKATGTAGMGRPPAGEVRRSPGVTAYSDDKPPTPVRLADIGVSKRESVEAQRLATLPPDTLEAVKKGETSVSRAIAPKNATTKPAEPTKVERLEARVAELERLLEEEKIARLMADESVTALRLELDNLQAIADGNEAKQMALLTARLDEAERRKNALQTENAGLIREVKQLQRALARLDKKAG